MPVNKPILRVAMAVLHLQPNTLLCKVVFRLPGFAPHPGMPDPEGRDRKHNAEGLRNDLRNILRNRKSGETLERYLSRQRGWEFEMVKEYTGWLRDEYKKRLTC